MSMTGKTTDSTRLHLKEAQEQIAELKLAIGAHQTSRMEASLTPSDEYLLKTAWGPLDSLAGNATKAL
jgi:hypothetical protein